MKRFFFATTTALALAAATSQVAAQSATFTSTDTPLRIPAAGTSGTITSTILVTGQAVISDVDVALDFNHTFFADLVTSVQSPRGTIVELFSTVNGGSNPSGVFILDDEAAANISTSGPTPGTYTPQSALLSDFDGENANGTWTLTIRDQFGGDIGTLNLWQLLITSSAKALLDELEATAGTFARLSTRQSFGNTRQGAQNSFATRDLQSPLGFGGNVEGAPVVSSKNGQLMGNLYVWGEFSGVRADHKGGNSQREFFSTGLQVGADVALDDNFVAGLSAGYNDLEERSTNIETEGDFFYVQPYLGYRRGAWSAEASLMYGEAEYDQTSVGGKGTADSDVWAIGLSVARDLEMSNSITLTPMASARYGEEDITGKSGTLAGAGSTTVDFSEYSVGARWTRTTKNGVNYIGLHADYVDSSAPQALAGGGFDPEGLSGRVEFGGGVRVTPNSNLSMGFQIGGIGSDLPDLAGQVRYGMNF